MMQKMPATWTAKAAMGRTQTGPWEMEALTPRPKGENYLYLPVIFGSRRRVEYELRAFSRPSPFNIRSVSHPEHLRAFFVIFFYILSFFVNIR